MIKSELVDSGTRIRHWSDAGMMIRQNETGIEYEDAVDVLPCKYSYTETDTPIPTPLGGEAAPEDYQRELNRLGVET